MATEDFEDVYDIENMGDDELKDLVLQELRDFPEIDVDLIEVQVRAGAIRLSGRVGTEQELQQVENFITDRLGVDDVANELVVDELVSGARSEGADDAWVEENEADPQTGEQDLRTSDTAAHLMDDTQSEQFGTHNVQEAIERGISYEPPDRGIQEGHTGRENH